MCRFTTKLFNSPSLPGLDEFAAQIRNVTGLEYSVAELDRVGLNIMGVERLINHRLGVGREHDTLPERWFEEPVKVGAYAGEKIDRAEFDAMLSRFYEISSLTPDGVPTDAFRDELQEVLAVAARASHASGAQSQGPGQRACRGVGHEAPGEK